MTKVKTVFIGKLEDITDVQKREKPEKKTVKKKVEQEMITGTRTVEEIDYIYYTCDYCGDKIIIKDNWEDKAGGIYTTPLTLWRERIKLALCNKCISKVRKELEAEK